jgi:hypothetical protein
MAHLDGNVLGGVGGYLFAFDATAATGECAGCQDVATLAEAVVYGAPMGFVVRCRRCAGILLVIVEGHGRTRLDMRGLRWLSTTAADEDRTAAAPSPTSEPREGL